METKSGVPLGKHEVPAYMGAGGVRERPVSALNFVWIKTALKHNILIKKVV